MAPTARHHPQTLLGDFGARELCKTSGSENHLLFTKSSRARGDLGPHCKPQAPPRCAERARSCGPQRPKAQAEFPPQEQAIASHPVGDPENVGSCGYINHLLRLNLKPGTVSNAGTQSPASEGAPDSVRDLRQSASLYLSCLGNKMGITDLRHLTGVGWSAINVRQKLSR